MLRARDAATRELRFVLELGRRGVGGDRRVRGYGRTERGVDDSGLECGGVSADGVACGRGVVVVVWDARWAAARRDRSGGGGGERGARRVWRSRCVRGGSVARVWTDRDRRSRGRVGDGVRAQLEAARARGGRGLARAGHRALGENRARDGAARSLRGAPGLAPARSA